MTIVYKYFIRPLLFLLPAERAHYFTFSLIKFGFRLPGVMRLVEKYYYVESPERKVFGLKFPSPIGLAAGFDKNAQVIDEMASLGFGFVEIGTVTPLPQIGNPKPRLFRLKKDQGIINRMGFNNDGMEAIVERLKKKKKNIIIGGNIGKNKVTPNEQAKDDYLKAFRALFGYVDYFVVNVSSPNTPNLRALQEKGPLMEILQALQEKNQAYPCPKPILLKIAPDLNESQLDEIIEVVLETKLEGVIATNTTISREGLRSSAAKIEQIGNGGLSGLPLRDRSTEVIRYLHQKSQGAFAIMGVGGIHRPEDAIEKLKAGASLVQVYTGFVYEGPGLIKKIKQQAKELRMVGQE